MLRDLDKRPRVKLVVLAIAALALSYVPVIGSFLGWFETFFHELSHGIVALLTGARIVAIELNWNGSGLIRYAGSWAPFLVTFFGYPGAVLCGVSLYLIAIEPSRGGRLMALMLAGLIAISAVLWMRDLTSWLISAIMIASLWALWRFAAQLYARLILELVAVYLMIGGVHSIWSMMGFEGRGDAKFLSEMSWLPAFIFPPLWLGVGLFALVWLWRREERRVRS